jgi:hypothetical protein
MNTMSWQMVENATMGWYNMAERWLDTTVDWQNMSVNWQNMSVNWQNTTVYWPSWEYMSTQVFANRIVQLWMGLYVLSLARAWLVRPRGDAEYPPLPDSHWRLVGAYDLSKPQLLSRTERTSISGLDLSRAALFEHEDDHGQFRYRYSVAKDWLYPSEQAVRYRVRNYQGPRCDL